MKDDVLREALREISDLTDEHHLLPRSCELDGCRCSEVHAIARSVLASSVDEPVKDGLDRMVEHLRTILAILVIAGWSDEQITTLVFRQLEIAHEDPETHAPLLRGDE